MFHVGGRPFRHLLVGVLGALLICLAPGSALELEVEAVPALVVGQPYEATAHLRMACEEVPGGAPSFEAQLQATAPEGILVHAPESIAVPADACQRPSVPVPVTLEATDAAPGETPLTVTFQVHYGDLEHQTVVPVSVAAAGGFSVDAPSTIRMGAPQKELRYEVTLVNQANTAITVHAEAVRPEIGGVVTPTPVQLGRAGSEDDTKVAVVVYVTPFHNGRVEAQETVEVSWHAETLEGTPLPDAVHTTLMAQTKGWYVPGPAPGLLLVGLALLAVRRRA